MASDEKAEEQPRRDADVLERRVAQLAAWEDENERREPSFLFRSALKGSPIVVFHQDGELRYTWVYNQHPGFANSDIIGKTDAELLPEDIGARLNEIKRRVLQSGAGERAEVCWPIGDEPFFYDLYVEPTWDATGKIVGVTCVTLDITERVRTKQALQHSEERHRALLHAIPDMMFRMRRDGTFFDFLASEEVEPLLPADRFLGKSIAEVLPGPVAGNLMQRLERAFQTGEVQTLEYPLEVGEQTRHFEARVLVSGQDEAVGIVREITLRRQAEATALQREQQLQRLLAAAIRLNSQHELEKVLQEVADSARDVIDCSYAALGILDERGDGLANFVSSGLTEHEIARIGDAPTGKGLLGLLVRAKHPVRLADIADHPEASGFPPCHPVMQSFLGVPVLGRHGPIGNLYFTEKKGKGEFSEEDESVAKMLAAEAAVAVQNARLLTELQSMQASRERFYAMVSHEVRNALTAVHGWAELFKRSAGPDPPRPVVETVEAAEYALDLVSDLLDLTRLEAAKIEPVITFAEAGEIAAMSVMVVEPFARQEDVRLQVLGNDVPLVCHTDAKRVQQILINLLRNAVRHSGSETTVQLKISATDKMLTFAVVDEGEGIDSDQQEIIFDAYRRATSKSGGGTGLGLTLSRSLARLLGGDIEVESMLGKGSTFTATIPRNLPEQSLPDA